MLDKLLLLLWVSAWWLGPLPGTARVVVIVVVGFVATIVVFSWVESVQIGVLCCCALGRGSVDQWRGNRRWWWWWWWWHPAVPCPVAWWCWESLAVTLTPESVESDESRLPWKREEEKKNLIKPVWELIESKIKTRICRSCVNHVVNDMTVFAYQDWHGQVPNGKTNRCKCFTNKSNGQSCTCQCAFLDSLVNLWIAVQGLARDNYISIWNE